MKNSSWTGRAPRTLNDAFGPYTSRHFDVGTRPSHFDRIAGVALAIFVGVAAAVIPVYL